MTPELPRRPFTRPYIEGYIEGLSLYILIEKSDLRALELGIDSEPILRGKEFYPTVLGEYQGITLYLYTTVEV
jgi:hypothetical protein